jgi:hypothetical protein
MHYSRKFSFTGIAGYFCCFDVFDLRQQRGVVPEVGTIDLIDGKENTYMMLTVVTAPFISTSGFLRVTTIPEGLRNGTSIGLISSFP